MFMILSTRPKNPQHFIALCFLQTKDDPSLKLNNKLLKKVWEFNNVAIFKCAYGFFLVNKSGNASQGFYPLFSEVKSKLKGAS